MKIKGTKVFEKSTPLRHVVEKEKCVKGSTSEEWKEIECNYSDGGSDHNTSYYSVKVAHICHFLRMDLDMLVAAVTYPGGSYVDPAERVMPLLNIAMNGVALAREKMSDQDEKKISGCNSMAALRKKSEDNPELENSLKESVEGCVNLLCERFQRVSLKDVPIKIGSTATEEETEVLFEEMRRIDKNLDMKDTTKANVQKCNGLVKWLEKHAVEHRYIFQLNKCVNSPASPVRIRSEGKELVHSVSDLPSETKDILIDAIHNALTCNDVWQLVSDAENHVNQPNILELIKKKWFRNIKKTALPLDYH